MRDRARLDASQLLPQRARHRAHAIRSGGDYNVLTQVPDPVNGADDCGGARAEELDEAALACRLLDLTHRHRALRHDELVRELWDLNQTCSVLLGEREHGVARHTGEDHAVQRGRNELSD